MKKIVIFCDEWVPSPTHPDRQTKRRSILRSITPNATWQGYYKNGTLNDAEVKSLARILEPTFTGYYAA